jgi:hypothetical protein
VDPYNLKDLFRRTPVFCAQSSEAVEAFLKAGFEDGLELVWVRGPPELTLPLLHHCTQNDIVSEVIASVLKDQLTIKNMELSPIEIGKHSRIYPTKRVRSSTLLYGSLLLRFLLPRKSPKGYQKR